MLTCFVRTHDALGAQADVTGFVYPDGSFVDYLPLKGESARQSTSYLHICATFQERTLGMSKRGRDPFLERERERERARERGRERGREGEEREGWDALFGRVLFLFGS